MHSRALPLPPYDLASRVGSLEGTPDPWAHYEAIGRASRDDLLACLPAGYELEGRRILDFGCGAGRTLRHFLAEDLPGEYWGCDIDRASIEWLQENLDPPVQAFVNDETPPLDQPDEMFDLVYCVSVFTHLTRSWSSWLLELHRVLKPGGLLIVTFMGEGQSQVVAGEAWEESKVGMLVLRPGQSWDDGGPMVLHSPWWIREHWGRLFDIAAVVPHGFPGRAPGEGHGVVTMRKKPVALTEAELEAPSGDPREVSALNHNLDHLVRDLEQVRPALDAAKSELRGRE